MKINIPEYFNQNLKHNSIKIDDFAVVDYKVHKTNEKIYTVSNANFLIVVLTGEKHIQFSDVDLFVSEGQAAFITSGNYIMNQLVENQTKKYESMIFCLSNKMLSDFYLKYSNLKNKFIQDKYKYFKCKKLDLSEFIVKETENLLNYFTADNLYIKDIVKLKIYEILLSIENENQFLFKYIENNILDKSSKIQNFMENNFDKPIKLCKFADEMCMSLSTFKRHFKAEFNDTPKSWINNRRLEKAAFLIKSSTLSITDICFMVGFDNISHFISLFKQKFKHTPRQYKNNY